MALICCLNHPPTESFNNSFVNPLPYEEDHCCSKNGCNATPVIWLNPEEVRCHENGTRSFQCGDFDTFKTQDSQVSFYTVNPVWQFLVGLRKQSSSKKQASQFIPRRVFN